MGGGGKGNPTGLVAACEVGGLRSEVVLFWRVGKGPPGARLIDGKTLG